MRGLSDSLASHPQGNLSRQVGSMRVSPGRPDRLLTFWSSSVHMSNAAPGTHLLRRVDRFLLLTHSQLECILKLQVNLGEGLKAIHWSDGGAQEHQ